MTLGLKVKKQGSLGRTADWLVSGLMRWLIGFGDEEIQKTHFWNNHKLPAEAGQYLSPVFMVSHAGDPEARYAQAPSWLVGCLAHATRFGGWRRYVVLCPESNSQKRWYVGWRSWHGGPVGVSRVPNVGPLRVLVGPGAVEWFGISADSENLNEQIPIMKLDEGRIGESCEYSKLPIY